MSEESAAISRKILSLSVLPLGWGGDLKKGMPSVYFAQKGLVDSGYEVHYVTLGTRGEPQYERQEGINIYRYFINFRPNKKRVLFTISAWLYWITIYLKIRASVRQILKNVKPDIVIGHTFYCALPAYCIARKLGVKCIFREYGTMMLYDYVRAGFLKRLIRLYEVMAYKLPLSKYILTDDGSRTKDVAILLGVPEKKIIFLKNGIFNSNEFHTQELPRDKVIIVTAARLNKYKNMDNIIRGFALSKSKKKAVLYVVGDGEMADELKQIAMEEGVACDVVFTGGLPRETVIGYFKASDIVISMGSINPLLESMACGKAIITLDLGDTAKTVRHMENGILLKKRDHVYIAESIDLLVENTDLRNRLGKNAKEYVSKHFDTWNERIKKEVGIISSAMRGDIK
jgi:glycosyltransferase involved in cell wall biosynthesis